MVLAFQNTRSPSGFGRTRRTHECAGLTKVLDFENVEHVLWVLQCSRYVAQKQRSLPMRGCVGIKDGSPLNIVRDPIAATQVEHRVLPPKGADRRDAARRAA